MNSGNLFEAVPEALCAERIEPLLEAGSLRIERILSGGHASPDGFWYEQDEAEWVALLRGAARLQFADGRTVALKAGDYLNIPAGVRHRVAWTDAEAFWLAVFYPQPQLKEKI